MLSMQFLLMNCMNYKTKVKFAEIDWVFSRDGFAEKYVQDVLVVKKS